jgi:hypothetical protein
MPSGGVARGGLGAPLVARGCPGGLGAQIGVLSTRCVRYRVLRGVVKKENLRRKGKGKCLPRGCHTAVIVDLLLRS